MAQYTICLLDDQGRPSDAETLLCASEAEGINAMLDMAGGAAAELWHGAQRILAIGARRSAFTRAARPQLQRTAAFAGRCPANANPEPERLAA
jgi:hypothetical protein